MNEPTLFPKAILSVNREEYYQEANDPHPDSHQFPLPLTVKKQLTEEVTTLPSDLQGSVFIIAPVGSVDSSPVNGKVVLPAQDGWTSLLNGDGMMYRLDFSTGQATLSSRFVNTPSRYADKIADEKYPKLKFINVELARLSPALGQGFQVNTAFLPMKFPGTTNPRLLATWDAGYPYEIDPDSLKVIAPVGILKDWSPLIEVPLVFPFTQMMASAHPGFDFNTGEVFGVNVVRSLNNLLWISRLFPYNAQKWIETLPKFLQWIAQKIVAALTFILTLVIRFVTAFLEIFGIGSRDHLYLMRWDGGNSLQKWKVVLPGERNVKIRQTVHQMGVTQDYIVLADTSFKIVLEDLIPAINPSVLAPTNTKILLRETEAAVDATRKAEIRGRIDALRNYLSYPQYPDTYLYIIDRKQLKHRKPGESITAQKVKIEREFAHFLVDYENPNGKITLNAALNTATDPAEFIHNDDDSVYGEVQISSELRNMAGMLNNALAINRPGFYVIDAATGKMEREELLDLAAAMQNTWYLALYAYRDDQPTQQFEDIYWLSFGAWTNTLSEFVYEMYKNYKYRQESLQTILDQSKQGVPVTLSRMHIDRNAASGKVLSIADSYQLPRGYFASSPQFVPRANTPGSTQGYLLCTVVHSDQLLSQNPEGSPSETAWSDNSEIWIFDAEKLSEGPQYRLSHSQLNLGFTLHSTWLQQVAAAPSRDYDVSQDFDEFVRQCMNWHSPDVAQQIDELFQQVYQEFNQDRKQD